MCAKHVLWITYDLNGKKLKLQVLCTQPFIFSVCVWLLFWHYRLLGGKECSNGVEHACREVVLAKPHIAGGELGYISGGVANMRFLVWLLSGP